MFDLGFSELFVIAIVALLVLGPERLPKAARFAGLWLRRARAQWYSVKSELEHELADDELKRSLLQTRDQLHGEMQQLHDGLQHGAQTVRDGFEAGAGETSLEPPQSAPAVPPGAVDADGPGDGTRPESTPADPLATSRPVVARPVDDHHGRH